MSDYGDVNVAFHGTPAPHIVESPTGSGRPRFQQFILHQHPRPTHYRLVVVEFRNGLGNLAETPQATPTLSSPNRMKTKPKPWSGTEHPTTATMERPNTPCLLIGCRVLAS